MDPLLLKTLHLAGVFALFASLGATMLGGSHKKAASALHGISLIFILLIGFAMLKKPPMDQYWWMAKLGLWLFIGAAPVLSKKKILHSMDGFRRSASPRATYAAYLGVAIPKPF